MGKFEKQMKKRLNRDSKEFDVWFEEHRERFSEFDKKQEGEETKQFAEVKVRSKKLWLIPVGFLLAAICAFLCFLPMILRKDPVAIPEVPDPPLYFGDEVVIEKNLSEEEYQNILQANSFLNKMEVTLTRKIEKTEDNSLVYVIINCELETETDYYFVTVQIEYNPYYKFISKTEYDNFEKILDLNSFNISYRMAGFDSDDLYWYYMLTEKNGQKIYWEVHCFEESISEFIELVLS